MAPKVVFLLERLNIYTEDFFLLKTTIKNTTVLIIPTWQQNFKQEFGGHCTISFLMEFSVPEKDIWHSDVTLEAGLSNSQTGN